jgi:hypothetical protein
MMGAKGARFAKKPMSGLPAPATGQAVMSAVLMRKVAHLTDEAVRERRSPALMQRGIKWRRPLAGIG